MYLTMSQELSRRHRGEIRHAVAAARLETTARAANKEMSHTDSPAAGKAGMGFERNIRIRWGLSEDEPRIGELLDLNGVPRWPAIGEQFLVAEEDGEVLAVMGYRTAPKRLLLGAVIADPWAGERDLAVALYAKARGLAREMGVRKILAPSGGRTNYPRQAGYRRRLGGWRLAATPASRSNG